LSGPMPARTVGRDVPPVWADGVRPPTTGEKPARPPRSRPWMALIDFVVLVAGDHWAHLRALRQRVPDADRADLLHHRVEHLVGDRFMQQQAAGSNRRTARRSAV